MNPTSLSSFARQVVGQHAVYTDSRLFRAGVFPERLVRGKPLEITEAHLDAVVKNFAGTVPGNIQHTNYLAGQACEVWSVWRQGKELRGAVAVPLWLDEHLTDAERQVSVELDPTTFERLTGLALCVNPRITDAQLMTWEQTPVSDAETFKKETAHTGHGLSKLQQIHDMAAMGGALCALDDDATKTAKMTTKGERKDLQGIHDMSLAGGASCQNMSSYYYTTPEAKGLADIPVKATTTPEPGPPGKEKPTMPLKWSDIKALFTGANIPVEDDAPTPATQVFAELKVEKVDVTQSAEFVALKAKTDALEAEQKTAQEKADAAFTTSNKAAVLALITSGKADPKDAESLETQRRAAPEVFDAVFARISPKPEYAPNIATIPAEAAEQATEGKPPAAGVIAANKAAIIQMPGGLSL